MSEQNSEGVVSSLYPPPPPYVRFFTDENIEKVKKLKEDGETEQEISKMKDLKFLIPPTKPGKSTYRSFGDVWPFEDRFITLKESGVTQLFKGNENENQENEEVFTVERIKELKKLTMSLLLNFLELVGLLSKNPQYAFNKINNIQIILINLHHLLNSYRLHQSRESLILRIEEKIRKDQETIDKIERTCENVEAKINMLISSGELQSERPQSIKRPEKKTGEGDYSFDSENDDAKMLKQNAITKIIEGIKVDETSMKDARNL